MLEKSTLKAGLQNRSAMSSGCVALHTAKSVNAKVVQCNVGPSGIFLENSIGGGGGKLGFPKIEGGRLHLASGNLKSY